MGQLFTRSSLARHHRRPRRLSRPPEPPTRRTLSVKVSFDSVAQNSSSLQERRSLAMLQCTRHLEMQLNESENGLRPFRNWFTCLLPETSDRRFVDPHREIYSIFTNTRPLGHQYAAKTHYRGESQGKDRDLRLGSERRGTRAADLVVGRMEISNLIGQ